MCDAKRGRTLITCKKLDTEGPHEPSTNATLLSSNVNFSKVFVNCFLLFRFRVYESDA